MKTKRYGLLLTILIFTSSLFAQLGIKAGVNMANEIRSFSPTDVAAGFNSKNLTGYQIGLVYQFMPKKSGLGVELAALLSQKGSAFSDSANIVDVIKKGYKEIKYLEVPFNLRYRLTLGFVGVYGIAGIYGGYALSGKTVNELTNTTQNQSFQTFIDHVDYGYNIGAGVELFKKIQFGGTWSEGIKNTSNTITGLPTPTTASNRVFSVNLVYLF